MLIKKTSPTLLIIIAAFLASALAWNALTPAYESLDEIEHAEVVRHIAATGRLPIHGEAEAAGYHVQQEASQPPLYHILAAGWTRLWGLSTAPHPHRPVPDEVIACGPSSTYYNKARHFHTLDEAQWPWDGPRRTLHALRLFSILLQIATLIGAWTLARRLFPTGPVPALTTILVAFNPQFLLVAAGVNNDNLMTPLATWGLILAIDLWQREPTPRRLVGFGLLSGLAGLSKLSGLALLGLGGLVLCARAWRERTSVWQLATWGLLLGLPALLIAAPWMLRNWRLYGDPTALAPMLEKVGQRQTSLDWGEARLLLLSYWAQMPCSFYPRALYWPYLLLMAGGLVGVAYRWRRLTSRQRAGLKIAALWFGLILIAWIRWDLITPAAGGRLLFPAAPALAAILAAGWHSIHRRAARIWAAALPILALVALRCGPIMFFAPPPRLPADVTPPNPTELVFQQPDESDGSIALRGYTAQITRPRARCLFASSSYCAPALDITLYWQAQATPAANWTMALQLVSPAPGDTTLRLNYNHWPGRGNLPTSTWPEGPIWRDHYVIPLPAGKYVTSAWRVQVAMIDPQSGLRVPVQQADAPAGDAAALQLLRAPDGNPPLFTDGQHPPEPPRFGEAVELRAYHIERNPTAWRVALAWESVAPLPTDATVFVHAYDADGNLLATGDGPPRDGHFPTSLWQPGDRIIDIHTLPAPDAGEIARVAVGLYDPATGERLPASQASAPLPNHAVILWEAEP